MALHAKESATKFDTKAAALEWINSRVVRFKLKVPHDRDANGNLIIGDMKKFNGRVVDTTAEDFKPNGLDEPLSNYAAPVKDDGKWLAVMQVREQ